MELYVLAENAVEAINVAESNADECDRNGFSEWFAWNPEEVTRLEHISSHWCRSAPYTELSTDEIQALLGEAHTQHKKWSTEEIFLILQQKEKERKEIEVTEKRQVKLPF